LKIYYERIDQDGNILWERNSKSSKGKIKLFFFFLFALLITSIAISVHQYFKKSSWERKISNLQIIKEINFDKKTQIGVLQEISSANIGLAIIDKKGDIKKWLPRADFFSSQADHFLWYEMGDFNKDGLKEIAFELQRSGSNLMKPFYLYQKKEDGFHLLLSLLDSVSETSLKDFDKDGILEVEHSFSLDGTGVSGRTLTRWKEIWAWDGKEYKKANNLYPEIYSDLVNFYNEKLKNYHDEQSRIFYQPILKCLLEKAKQNQKKIFADGRECFKEE
jgi:hypothetical protein